MQELNLLKVFLDPLNYSGIRYMVTGAVASMVYGEPRLTHDIDIVVELSEEDANRILEWFSESEFYCPPIEIIKVEMKRPFRGHFNLLHHETGFKADIYLMGEDSLHHWAMSKRRHIAMEGTSIWVAPPEYVILRKLQYYREGRSEKHLRDIAGMIEVSNDQIDSKELESKICENSLEQEWEAVQGLMGK